MAFSYSEITSRKNEKIIHCAKLCDKKVRDSENVFFAEGVKLVDEAIFAQLEISTLFFTQRVLSEHRGLLERANACENILVTDEVFEKLTSENAPQGIFAVIKKPSAYTFTKEELDEGGFIILDSLQNPQNLGAIFRCAYSLGFTKLILSKECADVYNPKTLRSAMGSIFKSRFYVCDDICDFIEKQKKAGNRVFCTHLYANSLTLGSFDFTKSDSIVLGNEGHGVRQSVLECCSDALIIPMNEGAESLNAATAAAIIMWEKNRQCLTSCRL